MVDRYPEDAIEAERYSQDTFAQNYLDYDADLFSYSFGPSTESRESEGGSMPTAAADAAGVTARPGRDVPAGPGDEEASYGDFLESIGVETDPAAGGIIELLRAEGIDVDDPAVQELIAKFGDKLMEDPNLGLTVGQLKTLYPVADENSVYSAHLSQGGFTGSFGSNLATGDYARTAGTASREGGEVADYSPSRFEDGENGYTRFRNGVLITPDSQVIYDPDSTAAGSPRWFRDNVASWSKEQALSWGARLHEMGYLTKEQAKSGIVDENFRGALAAFHRNRYLNGGTAVVGDASLTPGGSKVAIEEELVDFSDFKAQLRNDVRENYRSVYGTDPTDGEVKQMSNFIVEKGMELQRKYLRKGYSSAYGMAAAEATAMASERIENEPEAVFLRESTEENTRLRDSFQRAAAAANSMAF